MRLSFERAYLRKGLFFLGGGGGGGAYYRNFGRFYTRDAIYVWDEFGRTLARLVVCHVVRLIKDGHKTDYPSRRTMLGSASFKTNYLRYFD